MPPKVKIKNDTSEMIAEIARRMQVPVREIQNEFHMYWQDVGHMMTYNLGHSLYVENFGNFVLNVSNIRHTVRTIEKTLKRKFDTLTACQKYEKAIGIPQTGRTEGIMQAIGDNITKIILLDCSIKAYEAEVTSQYPNKYKAKDLYLKEYISRLEQHLGVALSQFPIQVSHPLQALFVREMQTKGFLPNPMVYKSKQMQ